jgi:hypothetical protein
MPGSDSHRGALYTTSTTSKPFLVDMLMSSRTSIGSMQVFVFSFSPQAGQGFFAVSDGVHNIARLASATLS